LPTTMILGYRKRI